MIIVNGGERYREILLGEIFSRKKEARSCSKNPEIDRRGRLGVKRRGETAFNTRGNSSSENVSYRMGRRFLPDGNA